MRRRLLVACSALLGCALLIPMASAKNTPKPLKNPPTRSPIKHLIVVIGENRSFDNIFGTYVPPDPSQKMMNLLSEGIVDQTGFPPGTFTGVTPSPSQNQASDTSIYQLSPTQTGAYASLPQPSTGLNGLPAGPCVLSTLAFGLGLAGPPTCNDIGLAPEDQQLLSEGGIHQSLFEIIPNLLTLTPVEDCRYQLLSPASNPGQTQPFPLPNGPYPLVNPGAVLQNSFGIPPFNATQCQALGAPGSPLYGLGTPVSPPTATTATDNTGDPVHRFFQMWQQADCNMANATATNPSGCKHDLVTWVAGTQGWGITRTCQPTMNQTTCSSPTDDEGTYQGGVAMGIYNMAGGDLPYWRSYAQNYALNDNYHQPLMGGTRPEFSSSLNRRCLLLCQSVRLSPGNKLYCAICNGFQYAQSIITTSLKDNLQNLSVFSQDVQNNTLPSVSFVKPSVLIDGNPGTSTMALFEAFAKNIVDTVQSNPKLWDKTAILITFDESGGEYDSGYIQPIDFFGDGPRTVMLAVSPFAKSDYVDRTYSDHVSILKFIKWNWKMKPLSKRSRNNRPDLRRAAWIILMSRPIVRQSAISGICSI